MTKPALDRIYGSGDVDRATGDTSLGSASDRIPGGVMALSADLRILSVNRGMADLVERSEAELIGASVDVLLSAPSQILFQTHVYPALRADGRVEEMFLTLTTGEHRPVPVLMNAIRAGDRERSEAHTDPAAVAYDALVVRIRARSRWEADLLNATRALEQERAASGALAKELAAAVAELQERAAEEARNHEFRDAFIGVISHELRTPITTIFGMALLLRRTLPTLEPAVVDEHLGDIVDESDRLRRLTEDLLVLSRAEGRRLEIVSGPIALPRIVERSVADERSRAPGHRLTVEVRRDLPLVLGDDVYVGQVLRNYLSNAIKYSPAGTEVRVVVGAEDHGAAVRVIDGGPGLPSEAPERLFELFYRSADAVRQKPGAGIGLFVCRELIGAMSGRVWARPTSGGSAEFGFWLPAAP